MWGDALSDLGVCMIILNVTYYLVLDGVIIGSMRKEVHSPESKHSPTQVAIVAYRQFSPLLEE